MAGVRDFPRWLPWAAMVGCSAPAAPPPDPTPPPPARVLVVAPPAETPHDRALRIGLAQAAAEAPEVEVRTVELSDGLDPSDARALGRVWQPDVVVTVGPAPAPIEEGPWLPVDTQGGLQSEDPLTAGLAAVRELVAPVDRVGLLFVGTRAADAVRERCLAAPEAAAAVLFEARVDGREAMARAVRQIRRLGRRLHAVGLWVDGPRTGATPPVDPAELVAMIERGTRLPVFGLGRSAVEAGAMVGPAEDRFGLGLVAGRLAIQWAAGVPPGELAPIRAPLAIHPAAVARHGLHLGPTVLGRFEQRVGETRPGRYARLD